jgi:DNA primase small subunit
MAATGAADINLLDVQKYYRDAFPVEAVVKWLGEGTLSRRELVCWNNVPSRFLSCEDASVLRRVIARCRPLRIETGAVYSEPPYKGCTASERCRPVGSELVVDIDATDYDEQRTCCKGTDVCKGCWSLVARAAASVDGMLRRDFGFSRITWVFSGRRGLHCWVKDERAMVLTDGERLALFDFMTGAESKPLLDKAVTVQRAHLKKLPFCVHPATGKVCFPLSPSEVTGLDPATMPTLAHPDLRRMIADRVKLLN